ncbi:MAG: hypothetical protein WC967_16015 [Balneolaceae bacterium]
MGSLFCTTNINRILTALIITGILALVALGGVVNKHSIELSNADKRITALEQDREKLMNLIVDIRLDVKEIKTEIKNRPLKN